jgi:hypothetical protein
MMAEAAGNPEKIERLRLTLMEAEAEHQKLVSLIEKSRDDGLLS